MVFSNPDKMAAYLELADPYDFESFRAKCRERGLPIQGSLFEYAQKAGMIELARRRFPDRTPFEAYMLFTSDPELNRRFAYDEQGNAIEFKACCGGGRQR